MTEILDFYWNEGKGGAGLTLVQMQALDNAALEAGHVQIQWLFPLPEASRAQPKSPILTAEDIAAFRASPRLQDQMRVNLKVMVRFFRETDRWRRTSDHNHLRITRILRSLTLLGLPAEANAFLAWLEVHRLDVGTALTDRTFWFWREALNENPAWLS